MTTILGIVAEYNPFHNGHLYHLQESKRICNADAVVCVMSGSFTQRGEPAIAGKWARAEMALLAGADLVVELPFPFACASAEIFAYGAVSILDALGLITHMSFGSETGDINILLDIARFLSCETSDFKSALKTNLKTGCSFPTARTDAIKETFINNRTLNNNYCNGISDKACNNDNDNDIDLDVRAITKASNNILAIEYLKALILRNSQIVPITVRRISNDYNTKELTGSISSATALRNAMSSRSLSGSISCCIEDSVPATTSEVLNKEIKSGRCPVFPEHFFRIFSGIGRLLSSSTIAKAAYVAEGLENRIKKGFEKAANYEELISFISTRRYTRTRIQRIITALSVGMTMDDIHLFIKAGGPQYIRVLGHNKKGRELLSLSRKTATLPVYSRASDIIKAVDDNGGNIANRIFTLETAATDLYVLAFNDPAEISAGQDYRTNPVIL